MCLMGIGLEYTPYECNGQQERDEKSTTALGLQQRP